MQPKSIVWAKVPPAFKVHVKRQIRGLIFLTIKNFA